MHIRIIVKRKTIIVHTIIKRKVKKSQCRNPGSNQGPLDLQSNALPTELFRLIDVRNCKKKTADNN